MMIDVRAPAHPVPLPLRSRAQPDGAFTPPLLRARWARTAIAVLAGCALAIAEVLAACLPGGAATQRWATLSDMAFRQVAQDSELPYSAVPVAIAEDADGFLWLGTQNGLARWDGYHFRGYTPEVGALGALPDTSIEALRTDQRGRLWIGTNIGGLARYDRENDRFISYPAGPKGLSNPSVWAITDDGRGGIWVGTGGGLDHLDPDTGVVTHIARTASPGGRVSKDFIRALLLDRTGTLWVGMEGGGLVRRRRGEFRFSAVPIPMSAGKRLTVCSLVEDDAGRVWIGTTRHGAFVLEKPATGRPKPVAETDPAGTLPTQWVRTIAQVRPGEVWLGTVDDGIVAVATSTMRTRRIRHNPALASSLRDDTMWALYRDRAGLVWAATNRSLSFYDPRHAAVAISFGEGGAPSGIRDPIVFAVLALPNGRVWLGLGSKGMDLIDPVKGRVDLLRSDSAHPQTALPADGINGLALSTTGTAAGTMYIGTERGLYRADSYGHHLARVSVPQRDPVLAVRAVFVDRNILWFGGPDGLWGLDLRPGAAKSAIRPARGNLFTDQRVSVIARGPGRSLLIGTQNGLNRFFLASRTIQQIHRDGADPTALWPGYICTLLYDQRGRLWVGGDGGIVVSERRDTGGRLRFTRLAVAQGLANADVSKLLIDHHGDIWASTDDGFAVIDPATFAIRTLRRADGVDVPSYFNNSGAATPLGDLVFGGLDGLAIVQPELIRSWTYAPPVVVSEMRIGGKAASSNRFNIGGSPEPATIGPDANSIAVGFSALDYTAPARNRYEYRLDGYDKDWVSSDPTLRLAAYTNLAPGDYLLRLRGSNRNGVWSGAEVHVPVRVLPAWHQTIWMHALEALAVLAFLVALVQGRTAFLRRHEHELEQQVVDRTAELEESRRHLEQLAYFDILTALPNRRMFAENFRQLLALTRRQGGCFALLLIDLDRFKHINDTLGHDAGDALLVEAAHWLRTVIRDSDSVSRLGGDEFAILLADAQDVATVELICRRIVDMFAAEVPFKGKTMRTSPSVGVAMFPADGETQDVLYKCADLALYEAKNTGRNTWRWYHAELSA